MKAKFRKERQAIQDFEKRLEQGESSKKMGTLTRWISLKRKTDKNNQVVKNEKLDKTFLYKRVNMSSCLSVL